jgi:hypothetical protein
MGGRRNGALGAPDDREGKEKRVEFKIGHQYDLKSGMMSVLTPESSGKRVAGISPDNENC